MSGVLLAEYSPPSACKRVVSGTISLPSQGFFSPFPHGTSSLSVANEYLGLPDGPGRFPQGSTCPAVLRSHLKEDCIFRYGAVTLYGRPFQSRFLNTFLSLVPPFLEASISGDLCTFPEGKLQDPPRGRNQEMICGPATPNSPCGSFGLACSEFARHYYRNHGCFLFLGVLRWFTSPRSPRTTMNSSHDNRCSHRLGSPIRTSPDHRLLASPRGLSQLATSFIAFLRQGIHRMPLVA